MSGGGEQLAAKGRQLTTSVDGLGCRAREGRLEVLDVAPFLRHARSERAGLGAARLSTGAMSGLRPWTECRPGSLNASMLGRGLGWWLANPRCVCLLRDERTVTFGRLRRRWTPHTHAPFSTWLAVCCSNGSSTSRTIVLTSLTSFTFLRPHFWHRLVRNARTWHTGTLPTSLTQHATSPQSRVCSEKFDCELLLRCEC